MTPPFTGRLRVVADGTPFGTRVFCEDVEVTSQVVSLTWDHAAAGKIPTVRVGLLFTDVDLSLQVGEWTTATPAPDHFTTQPVEAGDLTDTTSLADQWRRWNRTERGGA